MDAHKVMPMKEAVSKFVRDGDTAYLAGFTHLIPFAAGHEIIRQKKKDLTLCRATPDIIYDQMIAAGCAKKLVFSYAGNPGVGGLRCFRRSLEKGVPQGIEIEEYTHFGLSGRLFAGATNMPFLPVRTNAGDRKSTRLNSSHGSISYAVFCLKKHNIICGCCPSSCTLFCICNHSTCSSQF